MPQTPRDYSLDNLKTALTALVILHHTAGMCGLDRFVYNLPQLGDEGGAGYGLLSNFQGLNQGYFMSLFFFISALFIPASLERKGASAFIADKLKRYGVPLILTLALIFPLAAYVAYFQSDGFGAVMAGYLDLQIGNLNAYAIDFGVAWFLWTLLIFSGVYLAWNSLFKRGSASTSATPAKSAPFPPFWQVFALACIMIPVNFAALALENKVGENFLGLHHLKYFPMYVVMFTAGIIAARRGWIEQLTMKTVLPWTCLAILAYVWRDLGEMVTRPFTVIGMSMFLVYAFRHAYAGSSSLAQTLARASYAAYLIQTITIAFVGVVFVHVMTQNPLLNFAITGLFTLPLSFLVGHYLRQLPGLRGIL